MPSLEMNGGQRLRQLREKLGLVLKDVENASLEIARRHDNTEFAVYATRLSDIETKGVPPTIYRLYSLAAIYHIDVAEILDWYGVDLKEAKKDMAVVAHERTHRVKPSLPHQMKVPVSFDFGVDVSKTMNLGRIISDWGTVALTYLEEFADRRYTYAMIGLRDYTMYPLLTPGSVVQVDESRTQIEAGPWGSENERPLYLVEMREELVCCWCALEDPRHLILVPHPLSSVKQRIVAYPNEAEIVGRVIAIAKRLQDPQPEARAPLSLAGTDGRWPRPN